MPTPRYLTRSQAAQLCGVHRDSIRRAESKDELPNTRRRRNGIVEIAVADLVAAGKLDPLTAQGEVHEILGRSRAERELVSHRQELAVCQARIEELRERVARGDEQIAQLCSLLRDLKAG